MTRTPRVTVLVLNWNGWQDTINCVRSVLDGDYANQEVVIIDNGSTDGSEEILREEFPKLKVLQTGANLGFAGGMNVGIRYALAHGVDFVWLLNNDALVSPMALSAMVEEMASNERVGAVGSVIYDPHDRQRIRAYGGGRILWRSGRTRHVTTPHEIDYLTGASLLLRGEAIRDVGLLDERFFMYWEDVDYSLRLKHANWSCIVAIKSEIYHKEGGSTTSSERLVAMYNRSNRLFLDKYGCPRRVAWRCVVGRTFKCLARGKIQHAIITWNSFRVTKDVQPNDRFVAE